MLFIVCYYFEIKQYCPKLDERLSAIKHVQQRYILNVSVPGQKPVFLIVVGVYHMCLFLCVGYCILILLNRMMIIEHRFTTVVFI